jgi:hypothetical protein
MNMALTDRKLWVVYHFTAGYPGGDGGTDELCIAESRALAVEAAQHFMQKISEDDTGITDWKETEPGRWEPTFQPDKNWIFRVVYIDEIPVWK